MPVKVVETGEPGFKLGTEEPEGEAVGDETKISFGCLLPKYKIPPIKAKTATAVSAKIFLLAKIEDFGGTTILPAGGAGFSGIFGSGLDMLCPGKGEVLFSASPNFIPVGGAGGVAGLSGEGGGAAGFTTSVGRTDALISILLGACPVWADFISLSMVLMEERGRVTWLLVV